MDNDNDASSFVALPFCPLQTIFSTNMCCNSVIYCRKDDYDLCGKCFAEHGKEAEYKRIEQPLFAHRTGHPFCQIGRNLVR